MRQFTRRGGRLRALSVHARVVYSVFLAFVLAGLALTLLLSHDMVGLALDGLGEYYAGEPSATVADASEDLGGGPAIDLPDDLGPIGNPEPMARRRLLEVTHFHLFSMPVYLLVLSHLFALSGALFRTKTIWITAGTIGTAAHIIAPWWAASSAPASGLVYGVSGAALLVAFAVMSVVPLWEMWAPRSGASPDPDPDPT